jgi:penicillin-binding protein 2
MKKGSIFFTLLMLGSVACGSFYIDPISTQSGTSQTPAPIILYEDVPSAALSAQAYLNAWQVEDYSAMYAMLTQISRDAIDEVDFAAGYRSVAAEAALNPASGSPFIDYEILSALTNPPSAQVSYRVTLHSSLVGDIRRDTVMNLSLESSEWRVQWNDTLIIPDLMGGNRLKMEYKAPSRGNIYDRLGRALVAQAGAVALGLDTTKFEPAQQEELLSILEEVSNGQIHTDSMRSKIEQYYSLGWYLPIGDYSTEAILTLDDSLRAISGIILRPFQARYYYDGGSESIAPHITGYMSIIQAGQEEYYQRLGYQADERVGSSGLELWGEPYLGGKRGGSLYVISPSGSIVTKIAESGVAPAQSIYTSLDKEFQTEVQKALNGMRGAIVVLERDTGRVLALASSPGFNPNLFEPTNFNSETLSGTLYNQDNPLLNRATQGQYPLGSVFKIITMAAGLESGRFTAETPYNCGYFFTEIPGVTLNDWTYEYYLQDGRTQPSGIISLSQALTRSCNPYFWHIGLDLYNEGLTTVVSDMAVAFGLGRLTGVELLEAPGQIRVPASQIDSTNYAIGQGATLVTPIQVANFVAAVGNGGKLFIPQVVERIAPPDGHPIHVFTPTLKSELPLSAENLQAIQAAMTGVTGPQGTARSVGIYLNSYNIPVAGKTGTAQSGQDQPHAWFAGYTTAEREGQPDIAVAVVLENAGEGSVMAAPVFQGVVKLYFYGPPRNTFPWEIEPGVLQDSTPEDTGEEASSP